MRHRRVTGLRRFKAEPSASLLWETLSVAPSEATASTAACEHMPRRSQRLPFETRCAAITKSGRRCRGKIRSGTEFCVFHDPALTEERRRRNAARGGRRTRRLSNLPDGYLRKLTSRQAVGHAMDRLYREIRLGYLTPEMGRVLFDILTRLLDSGLCDRADAPRRVTGRARADRLRPKVDELLTYSERRAWKKAVARAPASLFQRSDGAQLSSPQDAGLVTAESRGSGHFASTSAIALPAAS